MTTDTLPGTPLPKTAVLYDADGNEVAVVEGRDGTVALAEDPRVIERLARIEERLDRLVEIGETLLPVILQMK